MLGRRRCRYLFSTATLALLISLLNILTIVIYLGPQRYKNSGTFLPFQHEIKNRDKIVPTDNPVAVVTGGLTNQVEHKPTHGQILESVVNPLTNKTDISLARPSNTRTSLLNSSSKLPVSEIAFDSSDYVLKQLKYDQKSMLMMGKPPKYPVEIVIGIPTVQRPNKEYLSSTLKQLVEHLGDSEVSQCHIVVFSADLDPSGNQKTANLVQQHFKMEVDVGLIEVIKPDRAFYSKLSDLPLLWKDKPDRVKWRSKQCLDYALLFSYCRNLGKYYLQLEDDVVATPGYFNQMKSFIQARGSSKWSNLQFGTRGFIGMLYRGPDLGRLALFVKMYYWIFPVDILFRQFNDFHLYGNSRQDVYNPPLFRHVGAESSLKGQSRKLEDLHGQIQSKKYTNKRQYKDANNPQCLISTNIEVFNGNTVDGPYRTANLGFFWGMNVKLYDFVLITFLKELVLLRVVVETGSEFAPEDLIGEAKLETSAVAKDGGCDGKNFALLRSKRIKGRIESSAEKFGGIPGVKCIRLTVTKLNTDYKGKGRWLVIREIAVWSQ